jgi:hypothetical protein
MRPNPYLEIRIQYVLARLALIGDPNPEENDKRWNVSMDAEAIGYSDAMQCHADGTDMDIPAYFADEPALRSSWCNGWDAAWSYIVTAKCAGCREARGDPCLIHG